LPSPSFSVHTAGFQAGTYEGGNVLVKTLLGWGSSEGRDRLQAESKLLVPGGMLQGMPMQVRKILTNKNGICGLVVAFLEGKTIKQYIVGGLPSIKTRITWMLSLLSAVSNLHDMGWVIGGLQPNCILIRSDNSAVLMEYGLAQKAVNGLVRCEPDSMIYGASETQFNDGSGFVRRSADIYSLGIIFLEILSTKTQLSDLDLGDAPIPQWYSLIQSCLDLAERRPTCDELYDRLLALESSLIEDPSSLIFHSAQEREDSVRLAFENEIKLISKSLSDSRETEYKNERELAQSTGLKLNLELELVAVQRRLDIALNSSLNWDSAQFQDVVLQNSALDDSNIALNAQVARLNLLIATKNSLIQDLTREKDKTQEPLKLPNMSKGYIAKPVSLPTSKLASLALPENSDNQPHKQKKKEVKTSTEKNQVSVK